MLNRNLNHQLIYSVSSNMIDNKKVIVVVEPHGDDAYLSCHQHILDWVKDGKTVIILSILSGTRKRSRDCKMYADAVGAQWLGLGFDELADTKNDYIKEHFNPLPGALDLLYELRDVLVVAPLGIQNEDHQRVSEWIRATYAGDLVYYCEIPYYTKHKNEAEVNTLMFGKKIFSIKKPKFRKADEKYWKCFKDQAKFFHFNPPDSYKDVPELLLKDY